jgi:beta-galactosidase/beta-glucuronidase
MPKEQQNRIPRPEYPRPQMVRDSWMNLNGEWQFEHDPGSSGRERHLHLPESELKNRIIVPFCPESKLSGLGWTDFMATVWYKREFALPEEWRQRQDHRILLHFGAVDYAAEVWLNGESIGKHLGGYTSFSFDITDALRSRKNVITVCADDDTRSGLQPVGKQSGRYESHGCHYTRTTGIWQTVWLECVPSVYIAAVMMIADPENEMLHLEVRMEGEAHGFMLSASAFFEGRAAGEKKVKVVGKQARFSLPITGMHLWEPGSPELYDLDLALVKDELPADRVRSYFGMRSIGLSENKVLINGRPVFQRLVLDQGFYPDGIYTAPSDDDLKRDIEIAMAMGFNGARLHEKIFEPRFLYWADRLGYLVWGEHANWGLNLAHPKALERFLPEWTEAVLRDYNHPSIVGWCPLNETQGDQNPEVLRILYNTTKALDPTRPVIDASGWHHVVTDILDVHDYEQDPEKFSARYLPLIEGHGIKLNHPPDAYYDHLVNFVSEYGGIWWNPEQADDKGWGYGGRPKTEKEFLDRYEKLTMVLLEHPKMFAFCYTQLYDVEQEVNGLYTYERKAKFDPNVIRKINSRAAAIEQAHSE